MTRKEITAILSEKTGFTEKESAEFADQVFEIMAETLERGEKIKIHGFGNFTVREKRARYKGRPKNVTV